MRQKITELFSRTAIWKLAIFFFLCIFSLGNLDFRLSGKELYNDSLAVPLALPKGVDFKAVHQYGISLAKGMDAYLAEPTNVYPPFVTVAFLPLTAFSADTAYYIYVSLLVCLLFYVAYFSLAEVRRFSRSDTALIAIMVVGLALQTYPINFALERGNSDIAAAAFAALSLLSLSRGNLIAAVILLAVSTQLKIYFAILIIPIFLRAGLRPTLYFLAINLSLLMMLGYQSFQDFLQSVRAFSQNPFIWTGNHSWYSFTRQLIGADLISWKAGTLMMKGGILLLLSILVITAFSYYEKNQAAATLYVKYNLIEIGIIGMCFCLMSLLPSVSHDYKLVIHLIPFLMLVSRSDEDFIGVNNRRVFIAIMAVLVALLFVPGYTPLPFRYLDIPLSIVQIKTPIIVLMFFGYCYLTVASAYKEAQLTEIKA